LLAGTHAESCHNIEREAVESPRTDQTPLCMVVPVAQVTLPMGLETTRSYRSRHRISVPFSRRQARCIARGGGDVKTATLKVMSNGNEIAAEAGHPFVVGRSQTSDVVIDDQRVSRR